MALGQERLELSRALVRASEKSTKSPGPKAAAKAKASAKVKPGKGEAKSA